MKSSPCTTMSMSRVSHTRAHERLLELRWPLSAPTFCTRCCPLVSVVPFVFVDSAMEPNDVSMTRFLRCVFERHDVKSQDQPSKKAAFGGNATL